jgi:hypothetical protein
VPQLQLSDERSIRSSRVSGRSRVGRVLLLASRLLETGKVRFRPSTVIDGERSREDRLGASRRPVRLAGADASSFQV